MSIHHSRLENMIQTNTSKSSKQWKIHMPLSRRCGFNQRRQDSKMPEKGSKFRALVKEKNIRGLRRGFKPSFSGKVYVVFEFLQNGRQVKAESGEVFTTKLVQPVGAESKTMGTQGLTRTAERRKEQTVAQRAAGAAARSAATAER